MKVLMINVVCGIRSTGRICSDLADALTLQGHEVRIAYGRESVPEQYVKYAVRIGNDNNVRLHGLKSRLFDGCGYGSRKATERFVEWMKEYDPDVIHLHNIHGYYINIETLFGYLRSCGKRIIWTLHDCWAFTGHAPYCESAGCERWVSGCFDCPKMGDYPKSLTDNSKKNWIIKKRLFTGIDFLQIVTPSKWLADLVKRSFLSEYPVTVIHNGIDTKLFKPVKGGTKSIPGLEGKKMILGVAALWEPRKGIDDFYKLSELMSDDYHIVLVGLSGEQMSGLPRGITGIERTNSVRELAELYSKADVYVNPTYEDNYPTTNLESIACGTPVVTYDTGGSPESAELFGCIVKKGDIEGLYEKIKQMIQAGPARIKTDELDISRTIEEYLRLYTNDISI